MLYVSIVLQQRHTYTATVMLLPLLSKNNRYNSSADSNTKKQKRRKETERNVSL